MNKELKLKFLKKRKINFVDKIFIKEKPGA